MGSKKKVATEKDVRYALEFGKERLIRTFDMASHKTLYTLSPSNISVPASVFVDLDSSGFLAVDSEGLFEGHAQSFKASTD